MFRLVPCVLASTGLLPAQVLMQGSGPAGTVRIFNTDAAILESQEPRKDLPCEVTPIKPILGFDLKFHAGYEVSVPLKDLAGSENLLTMVFRVSPENRTDEPVYFSQRIAVPVIEDNAKGDAYLQGAFDVGEGKYHVDWLVRDRSERVCSSYWDVAANLPDKDKQMALEIAPGAVQAFDREPFKDDPPIERTQREGPLDVKVIVNFAPQNAQSATLQPLDTNALMSILRSINRDPRIGKFSVVAFNMQEQRVLYRQDNASTIDFPKLGEALTSMNLGTVDLKRLSQKHGDTHFLASLISKELTAPERPDAVIFAGPKVMLDESVPQDTLREVGEPQFPVFYMNYNLNPQSNPWRDAIGNAVKYFKGSEYTISRPRDLFFAWTEIMSRIVKSKVGRQASNVSSK
ncbi:MAG: acetyltransferase [Acidobacteria bacterium]|nr:acetyltransferase [Acidobacteriota bacterium]